MRLAFVILTLALLGAGYGFVRQQTAPTSIVVKLPPARPATAHPGFRL